MTTDFNKQRADELRKAFQMGALYGYLAGVIISALIFVFLP